jgi:uncharacterized protein YycO
MRKHLSLIASALFGLLSVLAILLRLGYPHEGVVALAAYALAGVALALWLRQRRAVTANLGEAAGLLRPYARRWLAVLALLALAYVLFVLFPVRETRLLTADEAELRALVADDLAAAERLALAHEEALAPASPVASLMQKRFTELSEPERARLLDFWSAFVDRTIALETLVRRHRHFYQINYLSHPDLNLRSFLAGDTAFVASVEGALRLRALVGHGDTLETALNEARPELGIPGRSYERLAVGLTTPETLILLNAGRAHLSFAKRSGRLTEPDARRLIELCDRGFREIYRLLGRSADIVVDNPLKVYETTTFQSWFPVQKEVAEAMGDTRTARRPFLITPEQAHAQRARLEPGDIILERRNWYLSNVGLPGFWPHAALYTGDLDELDRYFAGVEGLGGQSLSSYLGNALPHVRQRYLAKSPSGDAPSVLEAVSEGVILHPFELSGSADYLAVLRPRLGKADKLKALLSAYAFVGRPYDFNFDFVTDDALVCSEVVFKAYRPAPDRQGLRFALETTSGRQVLPPNSIIRKFDRELGTPAQELDFVLFLDGSEARRQAYDRDGDALRQSWRRPKWDLAQR